MQKICVKSEQLKTTRNWSGNSAGNAIQKRREVPPEQQQTCAPHTKSSSAATQKTNTLQYLPTYLPTHPPTYLPTHLPTSTHNQCFFSIFFISRFLWNLIKKLENFTTKRKIPKQIPISLSENSEISPGKKKKKTLYTTTLQFFNFSKKNLLKVCWVQRGFFFFNFFFLSNFVK